MVTAVRLDKMSAVPVIAPEYLKPILRLPLRLDKTSAVPVISPAYQKPIHTDVKQKEYKKKVLFPPVSVHPLGDRVLSNYLASKTIHFRPKKPGAFSYFLLAALSPQAFLSE